MSRLGRIASIVGLAALLATGMLLLWPLNEPGVTGSPLAPHYREFGWSTYSALPRHPTLDDLRNAGIPVPQDAVHRRQLEAAASAAAGGVGLAFFLVSRHRRGVA